MTISEQAATVPVTFDYTTTEPEGTWFAKYDELRNQFVAEFVLVYAIVFPARKVTQDIEIHCPMKEGDVVTIPLAAATGDDAAFPDARTVDITRTGEPSVLDVSLLAGGLDNSVQCQHGDADGRTTAHGGTLHPGPRQPFDRCIPHTDNRFVRLSMLQPTRYWPEFCRLMGLEHFAEDPWFASVQSMAEHADTTYGIVHDAIAKLSFSECKEVLSRGTGQSAPVQDAWELAHDERFTANGPIANIVDADGNPQQLVASRVVFDDDRAHLERAPQFAEHTDDVLRDLGVDDDRLTELNIRSHHVRSAP